MRFFKERIKMYKMFKTDIALNKCLIISIAIIDMLLLFVEMLPAVLYKILIDDVMMLGQIRKLKWILIAYILCYFLVAGVSGWVLHLKNKLENRVKIVYRINIIRKYFSKQMSEYENFNVGDLKIRIIDDVNILSKFFSEQIIDYIMLSFQCVCYLVVLLSINWKMSVLAIMLIPITFLVSYLVGIGQKEINEKLWINDSLCNRWIQNILKNWKEVKALGLESIQEEQYEKYITEECKLKNKWMKYFVFNVILRRFKNNFLLNVFLYFIGGLFIINEMLSVGGLILIMQFYNKFFISIDQLNNCNISFKANIPSLMRVFDVVNEELVIKKINRILDGDICFEKVSFGYNGNSQDEVLKDFDLLIKKGEKVAIIGESGIGKTTVIRLLLGILQPQKGRILVNGYNVDDVNPVYLYKSIGVVMQENVFLNLSIKENLLLAYPKASDEEIIMACEKAHIAEFIDSLPNKYNTLIGENGVKLSGGQKQRLALARVFLKDSAILVLDEATSSLDKKTEEDIYMIIQDLYAERTVINISHNRAVLKYVNKVKKIEVV